MSQKNLIEKIKGIELQLEVLKGSLAKAKKGGGLKSLKGVVKEQFSDEEISAAEIKFKEPR
ncbi:MAG: hypothetical protein HY204_04405 [Nitrospirae bacterium]|nr:hypothetical protein [Nitrospirota bacterium]